MRFRRLQRLEWCRGVFAGKQVRKSVFSISLFQRISLEVAAREFERNWAVSPLCLQSCHCRGIECCLRQQGNKSRRLGRQRCEESRALGILLRVSTRVSKGGLRWLSPRYPARRRSWSNGPCTGTSAAREPTPLAGLPINKQTVVVGRQLGLGLAAPRIP